MSLTPVATINILNLLYYGTLGSIFPFCSVYFKYLGVSEYHIGILGAITPAVTFLVSPFWCAFADSSGKHREIMLLTFIASTILRCLLAFISKDSPNIWLLAAIVASSAALNAPVKPLLDAGILAMVADKSQYGKSRLYGQVGIGLGSYLAGLLIGKDYTKLFLFHGLISIPTALIMSQFHPNNLKSLQPASGEGQQKKRRRWFIPPLLPFLFPGKPAPLPEKQSLWMALVHTMKNVQVALFFVLIFFIGINTGIIENFAYVHLGEVVRAGGVGGDGKGLAGNVVGLLRLVSSVAGGPIFWLSGAFMKHFGVHTVLFLSFLAFVVRFVNYVSISHPLQALPAEILRGASFALFWSGATYYIYDFSPKHLTATMLSLFNGVYAGLGQSLGSILGGMYTKQIGTTKLFTACALANTVLLGLYAVGCLVQYLRSQQVNTTSPVIPNDANPRMTWLRSFQRLLLPSKQSSSVPPKGQ